MPASIDDIVYALQKALGRKERKAALLIGAGCSVSAGIPVASGFVNLIEKIYPTEYGKAPDKTYLCCMQQLEPLDRRELIRRVIETEDGRPKPIRINWAHICIAQLVKSGYVDRILTTNFDPLVVRACAMLGEFPMVYDFTSAQELKPASIPDRALFHLHGQYQGFYQVITEVEASLQFSRLEPVFRDSLDGRVVIVIGYSGNNDPVFRYLAKVNRFDRRLYWIAYRGDPPSDHVRKELLIEGKEAHYINGYDADSFFDSLAKKLNCFPPDFVGKPFAYLNDLLANLTPYRILNEEAGRGGRSAQAEIDVVEQARTSIQSAAAGLGKSGMMLKAVSDLMAAKYDKVIALWSDASNHSPELADLVAWAHVKRGAAFAAAVETASGEEARVAFERAADCYRTALEIKPDRDEALNNWGSMLARMARRKTGEEADRLFSEAYAKYDAAGRMRPEKYESLYNWGNALVDQARAKPDEEARRLDAQAEEKYAAALALAGPNADILYNWGNVLLNHARISDGADANGMFEAAGRNYAKAIELNPRFYDAWCNWGNTFCEQATRKSGAEADALYAEGQKRYESALNLKPDFFEVLNNMGEAWRKQAETKPGAEAEQFYRKSQEKYEAALKLREDPETRADLQQITAKLAEMAANPKL